MSDLKRARRHRRSYSSYARPIRALTPSGVGISNSAITELDSIAHYLIAEYARVVSELLAITRHETATAREVRDATRLLLSGELERLAVDAGQSAITRYNASGMPRGTREHTSDEHPKRARGDSRTARAGLVFSVARVGGELRVHVAGGRNRQGGGAPVFLAAVLDAVIGRIVALAAIEAQGAKRHRVTARHVTLAIRRDGDLDRLLPARGIVLAGGVLPQLVT
jgi:histone H2A